MLASPFLNFVGSPLAKAYIFMFTCSVQRSQIRFACESKAPFKDRGCRSFLGKFAESDVPGTIPSKADHY